MTQALNTEPEDLPENFLMRKEACCFPSMELREHAELVQAIMLNFPEIYFKSDRNQRRPTAERARSPGPGHPPFCGCLTSRASRNHSHPRAAAGPNKSRHRFRKKALAIRILP